VRDIAPPVDIPLNRSMDTGEIGDVVQHITASLPRAA